MCINTCKAYLVNHNSIHNVDISAQDPLTGSMPSTQHQAQVLWSANTWAQSKCAGVCGAYTSES